MDRTILHIDMNNFYASVELLRRPDLLLSPVVVGGDEDRRSGIVLAKNEFAKKFGVKTAETLYSARQKCPGLVVLPPHREWYREYSLSARRIYREYTDKVEPFGPDEAWLDVTARREAGENLGYEIKERIKAELGLRVSVGVSWNKVFAKMGSDYKKPDALTMITRDNFRDLLWPKDVDEFLFVGKATAERLRRLGIRTIGDLAVADLLLLSGVLGKNAEFLVRNACGENTDPVLSEEEQGPQKSIAAMETSDHDLTSYEEVATLLRGLCAEVAKRAAVEGMRGRTVRLSVRSADFLDSSRQRSFQLPLSDADEIFNVCLSLFDEHYSLNNGIRLLGVTLDQLENPEKEGQISLFDLAKGNAAKVDAGIIPKSGGGVDPVGIDALVDNLRKQFGDEIIHKGFKK